MVLARFLSGVAAEIPKEAVLSFNFMSYFMLANLKVIKFISEEVRTAEE